MAIVVAGRQPGRPWANGNERVDARCRESRVRSDRGGGGGRTAGYGKKRGTEGVEERKRPEMVQRTEGYAVMKRAWLGVYLDHKQNREANRR